tara:strand:- start:793 stop:2199 length:1407 start_codon:yes stop_codon:yes gene_type:complete
MTHPSENLILHNGGCYDVQIDVNDVFTPGHVAGPDPPSPPPPAAPPTPSKKFFKVTKGTCESNGYSIVTDKEECVLGAKSVGMDLYNGRGWIDFDPPMFKDKPAGCVGYGTVFPQPNGWKYSIHVTEDQRGNITECGGAGIEDTIKTDIECVCKDASAPPDAAPPAPVAPPTAESSGCVDVVVKTKTTNYHAAKNMYWYVDDTPDKTHHSDHIAPGAILPAGVDSLPFYGPDTTYEQKMCLQPGLHSITLVDHWTGGGWEGGTVEVIEKNSVIMQPITVLPAIRHEFKSKEDWPHVDSTSRGQANGNFVVGAPHLPPAMPAPPARPSLEAEQPFVKIDTMTCEAHGFSTITTQEMCLRAAIHAGVDIVGKNAPPRYQGGFDQASDWTNLGAFKVAPAGCIMSGTSSSRKAYPNYEDVTWTLKVAPEARGGGACGSDAHISKVDGNYQRSIWTSVNCMCANHESNEWEN